MSLGLILFILITVGVFAGLAIYYRNNIIWFFKHNAEWLKRNWKKIVAGGIAISLLLGATTFYPYPPVGAGWIAPDNTNGTDAGWANPDNAINNNTDNYAEAGSTDDGLNLVLNLTATLSCSKIRIYCYDWFSAPENATDIDIDGYWDGGWNVIVAGQTVTKQTYVEYSLPGGVHDIGAARVRDDDIAALHVFRVCVFQFYEAPADAYGPEITITFAGNPGDEGGPKYQPPNETGTLAGEGYYTNSSRQTEGYINITAYVTDSSGVSVVWLQWLNDTTWTNWTYQFTGGAGNIFYFNSSNNLSTAPGYNYSFNIVANDTLTNSNTTVWAKTGIGGGETRIYVGLNYSQVNITYVPFYITNYSEVDAAPVYGAGDVAKPDRLHHDQGTDGTINDTGYLINLTLTDTMSNVWCSGFAACWVEQSLCVEPIQLKNFLVHTWWSCNATTASMYWKQGRGVPLGGGGGNDNWTATKAGSVTNITIPDDGLPPSNNYFLETHYETIEGGGAGEYNFTDNNIYEFSLYVDSTGDSPSFLCNKSIQSYIIFNVPDDIWNGTDNSTDTDSDGLSDHMEINTSYGYSTNPFEADTDNDGVSDYYEILSDSDPNNFSETFNITVYNTIIQTDGVDYFIWLSDNISAYHVAAIMNTSATITWNTHEFIAIWNGSGTWSEPGAAFARNGTWYEYHVWNGSGFNWTLTTCDVIKVHITDDSGDININMTENSGFSYTSDRSVSLINATKNRGGNFTGYTNTTSTTLSSIATAASLASGEALWLWNETNYDWDGYVVGFGGTDAAVHEDDVVFTKVEATRTWTIGGKN